MKRIIKSASYMGYKYQYEVHWMTPDGVDKLLGASSDLSKAEKIAIDNLRRIVESPWETPERKALFIQNCYIYDVETDEDVTTDNLVDIEEEMMSKLSVRGSTSIRKPIKSATSSNFAVGLFVDGELIGYVASTQSDFGGVTINCTEESYQAKTYPAPGSTKQIIRRCEFANEIRLYDELIRGPQLPCRYFADNGKDFYDFGQTVPTEPLASCTFEVVNI